MKLEAIVLAYNAEWSLRGGLSYLAETIRGEEPCELCKITYGGLTKKADWTACEKQLIAPVEEVYRNQLGSDLLEALGEEPLPVVMARTDEGVRLLVTRATLETLEENPAELQRVLLAALNEQAIQIGSA